MLHWMAYCLLLNNVYRIGDVFTLIWELSQDLRSDFVYARQTSLLRVKTDWVDHCDEILFAGMEMAWFTEICVFSKTEGPFLSIYQAPMKKAIR